MVLVVVESGGDAHVGQIQGHDGGGLQQRGDHGAQVEAVEDEEPGHHRLDVK